MSLQSRLLSPFFSDKGYQLIGPEGTPVMAGNVSIATTGNTDILVTVPHDGHIRKAVFSSATTLAASDTNYITFSITNLDVDGTGSTAVLAATDTNTTKATGGTGLTANTRRELSLNATQANQEVKENQVLRIRFAVTGTLGATNANANVRVEFVA